MMNPHPRTLRGHSFLTRIPRGFPAVTAALLVLTAGCASRQPRYSGFLSDYEQLRDDGKRKGVKVHYGQRADFVRYNKMTVDPVAIYYEENGGQDIDEQTLELFKIHFRDALMRSFRDIFRIVEEEGEDVIRLRTAVTNLKPGRKIRKDETDAFLRVTVIVKDVTIEAEFLDARSNERLAAVVIDSAGERISAAALKEWRTVKSAFGYWTRLLKEVIAGTFNREAIINKALDAFRIRE